jgi:hypothetical protein
MSELSIDELESEHADLLPERETLFLNTYNTYFINQHSAAVAAFGGVAFASNNVTIVNL